MAIRSIFYGWWVVAAFSFMTCISTGIRHAVGPFLKPIVADLGLDRASFSLVIALSLFLYGVFGPLVGLALDRFGARLTASVGTLVLVLSLVLTAFVRNYWDFAVVYGVLLPLGLAVTGPVMASGVVARWFSARRGTALSLLGSASMTGMSLLVRLLDEPALRPRDPDADRSRLLADVRVVDVRRARWLEHRLHGHAGRAVRSLRPAPGAGRHLRGPRADLRRLLPDPRQPRGDPDRRGPRRHHDGRHGRHALSAHRRHLGPLLGEPGARRDLPRAPDGLGHRLVAGRRDLRSHRRLPPGPRPRPPAVDGGRDRGAQDRPRLAPRLACTARAGLINMGAPTWPPSPPGGSAAPA